MPDGGRPLLLRVALGLVLLEAVGLAAFGLWTFVELATAGFADAGMSIGVTVALVGFAALLVAAARALWLGRRWGRGPVVTWQLLQFAVGASAIGANPWWATYVPMAVALVVVAGLLAPASLAATRGVGPGPNVL